MPEKNQRTSLKEYILERIGVFYIPEERKGKSPFLKSVGDIIFLLLRILSFFYGFIIRVRNFCYDMHLVRSAKLDCKVISIGNITVGGTGKTPAVVSLARYLIGEGKRVCILLRGYKGKGKGKSVIITGSTKGETSARDTGDEALVITSSVPEAVVIAGGDRVYTGRIALEKYAPDVIILDDAFQHRRLERDVDVLIVDYEKPFGNGRMLPAGVLREPPRNIKRADIVIFTRVEEDVSPERFSPPIKGLSAGSKKYSLASHVPKDIIKYPENEIMSLEEVDRTDFLAFSGIARPDSFEKLMKDLNIPVIDHLIFEDHHVYKKGCYNKIKNRARELGLKALITTQKDLVKIELDELEGLLLHCLRIDFEFKSGFAGWKELLS